MQGLGVCRRIVQRHFSILSMDKIMNIQRGLRIAGMMTAMLCGLWNSKVGFCDRIDLSQLQGWDIVIGESAIPSEQYAATEFQELVFQSTGTRLPIVNASERSTRHVFIGASPALENIFVGFEATKMIDEDLRIVIRDDNIAIAGGRPRGTLYGVYQFLEDFFGVRFLTFDHTHVPKIRSETILKPVDRNYHSPLAFRFSYYGENFAHPEFATRLRVNTISDDAKLGGKTGRALINHSFGKQIPSQQYGKEHPEYFAERAGKRLASVLDDFGNDGTEPCLTNPDVLKIVTAHVLKELAANPKAENISVSQNDNNKFCQCRNCVALDEKEGSSMGTQLTFVNAVAEQVERLHPNVKVGTLAYWYTRHAPKTVRPRSNVQIQLCSIECCLIHSITDPKCPLNGSFREDMRVWGQLCDDIAIWNYNTNFSNYQLPCPNLRTIEPNIRYFVANHAKGIFMQAAGNTTGAEFSDLRNYLISRLLWNPDLKGDDLVNEFLSLHYGAATAPIRQFIQLVHDEAEANDKHQNCSGKLARWGLDASIGERGLILFADAARLAENDVIRARVEKASICAWRAAIERSWILKQSTELDALLAAQQRPLVKRFFELCQKYGVAQVSEQQSVGERLQLYRQLFDLQETDSL